MAIVSNLCACCAAIARDEDGPIYLARPASRGCCVAQCGFPMGCLFCCFCGATLRYGRSLMGWSGTLLERTCPWRRTQTFRIATGCVPRSFCCLSPVLSCHEFNIGRRYVNDYSTQWNHLNGAGRCLGQHQYRSHQGPIAECRTYPKMSWCHIDQETYTAFLSICHHHDRMAVYITASTHKLTTVVDTPISRLAPRSRTPEAPDCTRTLTAVA